MANRSKGIGYRNHNHKLNPATLAIRRALALGLAMSLAQPVLAGTCDVADPANATCDGDFVDVGIDLAIDDLTLVVGGDQPTTIDPVDGMSGIDLYAANGAISLTTYADMQVTDATAILVQAYGDIAVHVAGDATIAVQAAYADAAGIVARSVYAEFLAVVVDGAIDVSVAGDGDATGILATNHVGDVDIGITGSGAISASTDNLDGGIAIAVHADTDVGAARVVNGGDVVADASASTGDAAAYGIAATVGYLGFAVALNYGAITAAAHVSGDGSAGAVGIYAAAEVATVVNEGDVVATAEAGTGQASATAVGIYGVWAAAFNYGDLTAVADVTTGDAVAFAIDAYAINGSAITNSGDIAASASAVTGNASAGALLNFAYVYDATVVNDGSLAATAVTQDGNALASGVVNIAFLYGHADTTNAGDIVANATVTGFGAAEAMGIYGYAFIYGPQIVNAGSVVAMATAAAGTSSATGIELDLYHGDSLVQNDGLVAATATTLGGQFGGAYAYGVIVNHEVGKYNFPNTAIVNHGDLVATATHGGEYGFAGATGVRATMLAVVQYNDGLISASAVATGLYGTAEATGTVNLGKYALEDVNDGSIVASAEAHLGGRATATGVSDIGFYYDATTINRGTIGAYAISVFDGDYGGQASATALYSHAGYVAVVDNAGAIVAHASADYGTAEAAGVLESSKYATATLTNAGDIVAIADAWAGYASATGADVGSKYGGITVNDGLIAARAYADGGGYAEAIGSVTVTPGLHGYNLGATTATLYNSGTISAIAHADGGQALAIGSRTEASNDTGASTTNTGTIVALADAAGGQAFALGTKTWSYYGDVALANYGDILAGADGGDDGIGSATGAQVSASGAFAYHSGGVTLANSGTIAASAHGGLGATAIGVRMDGETGASAANAAIIGALAEAGSGLAQAAGLVLASSAGSVDVTNSGDIVATANGSADSIAFGVHLTSAGTNTLTNTGSIVANGTGDTRIAVWSSDDAVAVIDNLGLLVGGIRTGALDDALVNHAGATLVLDGATVDLGGYAASGNTFANFGAIVVRGASRIDMGQGAIAANPFAFANGGVIDFRDGAADDVLTIAGDLDGDGQWFLDVSGLHGSSDLLYVDGSVAAGSTGTLDLHLLDMPTTDDSTIALVRVAGDAGADAFVLGNVTYAQNSFLALAFDTALVSRIDPGNTRPDEFSLGVRVTGLNDTGTLAAALAPGVQGLLNTQVGTWHQRMGVVAAIADGGVNLWGRLFRNDGTIAPDVVRSNFGDGGNYAFDQDNSGTEVGADFAFSEFFSAGVLLAESDARLALAGAGAGSARIDGDTVGVYATVLTPGGFFLDTSYRQMDFNARVATTEGRIHGEADAFNVELGIAWTLANGLQVQPQYQSTWTQVDSLGELSGDLAQFVVDGGDSWRSRLGMMVGRRFAGGGAAWTPYASVNLVHEWNGTHDYSINGDFFGATSTGGTSALLEAGVNVRSGALSFDAGLNWQDGGALESVVGGQLNVRYAW